VAHSGNFFILDWVIQQEMEVGQDAPSWDMSRYEPGFYAKPYITDTYPLGELVERKRWGLAVASIQYENLGWSKDGKTLAFDRARMIGILVPVPALAGLAALPPLLWLGRKGFGRRAACACPACGYDLRRSESPTCPECGADIARRIW
jgi:hypothetical protein